MIRLELDRSSWQIFTGISSDICVFHIGTQHPETLKQMNLDEIWNEQVHVIDK